MDKCREPWCVAPEMCEELGRCTSLAHMSQDKPVLSPTQRVTKKELLAFINDTPVVLSLLYDLDLMPEQCKEGSLQRDQMLLIAAHFKAALAPPHNDHEPPQVRYGTGQPTSVHSSTDGPASGSPDLGKK